MINHWVITSALADSGCFSEQDKFHQTLLTINSIRKHSTNNHIMLVEGSDREITGVHRRTLVGLVDWYLDTWSMPEFQRIYHTSGRERQNLKSSLECFLMLHTLNSRLHHLVQPDHRVYKITGRYKLTAQFQSHAHQQQKHKWCFAQQRPGLFMGHQRPGQLPTRMYSFCGSLMPQAQHMFQQIQTKLESDFNKGVWLDMEHAMFDHLNMDQVHQITPLGVDGFLSNCGTWVSD